MDVSEAARSFLAGELGDRAGEGVCYRLHLDDHRRMSTTMTTPRERDTLVPHRGHVVLAIEPRLAGELRGSRIDIERTPRGDMALIVL